jgi:hypothetical protein
MTVRYKRPDKKNALSLVEASERDMEFTLTLPQTEEAGSTIVKNIYECFLMLGNAMLVLKGQESYDHLAPIKELMDLRISTARPLNLLDNLRRLRININYYGYRPALPEVEETIRISHCLFGPILSEIKRKINTTKK